MKLNPRALGLTLGIIHAVSFFILALLPVIFYGWAKTLVLEMSSFYTGYSPSFYGAIIGAVYGFLEGIIIGYIIALLYNKFSK